VCYLHAIFFRPHAPTSRLLHEMLHIGSAAVEGRVRWAGVQLAEIHRSRDANTASEMQDLPTRTPAGRNPGGRCACGRQKWRLPGPPFATLSRPGWQVP
jgi:hypothetical protein